MKNNKKHGFMKGCLTVIIVFFVICAGIGIIMSLTMDKVTNKKSESVKIIEDAEQFSRISMEELKDIMGEPMSEEPWTNKTGKGDFEVITLSYDKGSNHYEFIIADDSVVRLSIYSDNYWNKSGDRFLITGEKSDICKSFNIILGDNAKKTADTGYSYTLSPVNNKVAIFDVQDIDGDTYGFVKITYNLNYFD